MYSIQINITFSQHGIMKSEFFPYHLSSWSDCQERRIEGRFLDCFFGALSASLGLLPPAQDAQLDAPLVIDIWKGQGTTTTTTTLLKIAGWNHLKEIGWTWIVAFVLQLISKITFEFKCVKLDYFAWWNAGAPHHDHRMEWILDQGSKHMLMVNFWLNPCFCSCCLEWWLQQRMWPKGVSKAEKKSAKSCVQQDR